MIPPLHKSITVEGDLETAFRRFTAEMGSWWPLRSHSVGGDRAQICVFEGRVGGRIYEVHRGGGQSLWGTVTAWEPPSRVAFTWHPGRAPETAQQVEVRFVSAGGRTRLELTHSDWDTQGPRARRMRRAYGLGWGYVLQLWAGRRSSALVLTVDALSWVVERVGRLRGANARA
jgi:uncharacterized protein YndB with AHSA1/START domain